MAQSLSDEEFQRLQNQLLELRTANYQFADQNRLQSSELTSLRNTVAALEKDLQKATKSISKSKKAQEFELLLTENDQLQMKMVGQEDDFKLQNSTMMQELSMLYDKNEKLEREKKALEESQGQDHQAEIRRLQATNTALQKNLDDSQQKYQHEVNSLKHQLRLDETMEESRDTSNSSASVSQNEEQSNKIDQMLKELSELTLRADTEREENKMLKDQLATLEKQYQTEHSSSTTELSKLQEKLKKKQESFLQLQNEKDGLYVDNQKQLEELTAAKDRELKVLIEQNDRIQAELTKTSQSFDVYQDQQQQKIQDLEATIQTLQTQVDSSRTASNEQLQQYSAENASLKSELDNLKKVHNAQTEELDRFQNINSALSGELQALQAAYNSLVAEKEDLQFQLTEGINSNSQVIEQLQQVQAEKETVLQDLAEANKVAEKRKSMLDEMAIQIQTTKQQHTEQINSIQDNNKKEQDSLREQLQQEVKEKKALEEFRDKVPELESRLASTENAKGWFERSLAESEENLKQKEEEHKAAIEEMKIEHAKDIEEKDAKLEEKDVEIQSFLNQLDEKEKEIEQAKQETKDMVEEKKIAEKKGVSMAKDLKRQLHLERKRGEKLQERLQEILSENSGMKSSVDELFKNYNAEERPRGDSSSVSSWAASMKENSELNQSNLSEHSAMSATLNEETSDLLSRMTEIQEEKWSLEERVNHLETSNACMADDIMKKSAIIQFYFMDRADLTPSTPEKKTPLHKMLGFVKGEESEDNCKEVNRKLQRMLEETLTKNMHLQKDIEMLSDEIVRLSKLTANASN